MIGINLKMDQTDKILRLNAETRFYDLQILMAQDNLLNRLSKDQQYSISDFIKSRKNPPVF